MKELLQEAALIAKAQALEATGKAYEAEQRALADSMERTTGELENKARQCDTQAQAITGGIFSGRADMPVMWAKEADAEGWGKEEREAIMRSAGASALYGYFAKIVAPRFRAEDGEEDEYGGAVDSVRSKKYKDTGGSWARTGQLWRQAASAWKRAEEARELAEEFQP